MERKFTAHVQFGVIGTPSEVTVIFYLENVTSVSEAIFEARTLAEDAFTPRNIHLTSVGMFEVVPEDQGVQTRTILGSS